MIAKKHQGLLQVFEKSSGMTAVFSGQELKLLQTYIDTGRQTAFSRRLHDLGLLADACHREIMAQALRQEQGTSLEALHIELTDKCPLACPQCYKARKQTHELAFPVLVELVQQAQQLKIFQIAFGGGEPLVYPELLAAVRLVAKTPMAVSLTSSGYGLDEKLLDELTAAGLNHMQVSLNALEEKTNRLSRDGYIYAMAALKLLSRSKLSFGINYVVRQDNLTGLSQLAAYAHQLGADNINVLRYKPAGREDFQRFALTAEQTKALAEQISKVTDIKVKVDSAYSQLLVYLLKDRLEPLRTGCGAGKNFLAVTASGQFSPCSHLPLARTAPDLAAYLTSQALANFQAEKNKLTGLCGGCFYRKLCGGCRAVCLAVSGRINAGEQECLAFKEDNHV